MTLQHDIGDIRDALMGINDSLKALVDVLSRTVQHPSPSPVKLPSPGDRVPMYVIGDLMGPVHEQWLVGPVPHITTLLATDPCIEAASAGCDPKVKDMWYIYELGGAGRPWRIMYCWDETDCRWKDQGGG
jgi:hypothetical protein